MIGSEFLFPLLGCNATFRRNGLRGRFAGGCVDLLTRIGQKAGDLSGELHGCIGSARRSREGAHAFRAILGSRVGIRQGQTKIYIVAGIRMRFERIFTIARGLLRMVL